MTHPSYRKGYNFERRVIKHLEKDGWFVVRSGKSKFPDLVAIKHPWPGRICAMIIVGECKVRKYLSREEKVKAREIYRKTGVKLTVYWRDGRNLRSYKFE